MEQSNTGFSKLRSVFWPVYRQEAPKFLPMILFFFLISFNYHLLRIAKDVFIVTAPKGGAESLAYLKVWVIVPSAIFFTFLYTKLSNRFNREQIFYVISLGFLLFFTIFALVLFPNKDHLFLDSIANYLQKILPKGLSGFIALIRYWIYSLFYIAAETWSTLMLSVLAWGFANDVVKVHEAKRFYALFGVGVNAAGILAGGISGKISKYLNIDSQSVGSLAQFLGAKTPWDQTVIYLVAIIIAIGIGSMFIYRYLHTHYFKERASFAKDDGSSVQPSKMKFIENIKYLFKSKYVLSIATIVLSYNIFMNFSEILWKSQMKELFTTPGAYIIMMSRITFYTGIAATISSYLITGNFIRRFGWKATAMITPIIEIITGLGFYYFLFVKYFHNPATSIFNLSPLALCVIFGSLQNIFSRCAKYTVFDSTKEMAYIPLSDQEKIKGKSAIDGIGSRLGKSGSSLSLQALIITFGSPIACAPAIFPVIVLIMPIWIYSIHFISKAFKKYDQPEKKPALNS